MYATSWVDRNSDTDIALIVIILCYYCLFIWDQHGFYMVLNSFAMLLKMKPINCPTRLNQNQHVTFNERLFTTYMIAVTFSSIHVRIYSQLLAYKGTHNQASFKQLRLNIQWLNSAIYILKAPF